MFFKWLVLGKGGVDDVGREPAGSSDNAVLVAMACTHDRRAETFHSSRNRSSAAKKNVEASDAGL